MTGPAIRGVVDCWANEVVALRQRPEIASVQVFENRGAMMGASNPHPHGQIWATSFVLAQRDFTPENAAAWLRNDADGW